MVYTVEMHLQTTDFMEGIRKLATTVGNMQGYLISENIQGRDLRAPEYERNASYVLRLHTDRLLEFLIVMEDNFNLVNRRQVADDITASYEYSGLTLSDLREQETRMKAELESDELTASERRNLESSLANVQSSIRSHETQQSVMDDNVLYSTISIHLSEVIFVDEIEIIELTFGERFFEAVTRSWDGFVAFGQGLLIVIINILPTLIVLAVITVITFLIVLRYKRWRKANPRKQKSSKPAVYPGYPNWNNNTQQYYNDPNVYGVQNGSENQNIQDTGANINEDENSGDPDTK